MADAPGTAPEPTLSPGAGQYNALIAGGVPVDKANDWREKRTQALMQGGVPMDKVAAYWGEADPHSPALAAHISGNMQRAGPEAITDPLTAFAAGWDTSVTGLSNNLIHGKPMIQHPGEPVGIWNKIAHGAGQMLGDVPAMIPGATAGAAGGGVLGAAVPVAGETGASEAVGAVAGAGFGAGAAPEGARQALIIAYNRGEIHTWQDALHVIQHASVQTVKAGVAGMAGSVAGPVGGKFVGKVLGVEGAEVLGNLATNAVVATTANAAMDGHIPNAEDFTVGAVLALGTHAGLHVAGKADAPARIRANLQRLYVDKGILPWDAVHRADTDPVLRQEIFTQDPHGEPVAPKSTYMQPAAHQPFKQGLVKPAADGEEAPGAVNGGTLERVGRLETGGLKNPNAAVSPTGAIGKYQVEPGTARQYGFDPSMLHDEQYNKMVSETIIRHLAAKYHNDETAVLIGYNAGPGRANQYMAAGPGTRLRAIPDKTMRGGFRFEKEPADRDESFLPQETQRYAAKARVYGAKGGVEMSREQDLPQHDGTPSFKEAAPEEPAAEIPKLGGAGGSVGAANRWEGADDQEIIDEIRANVGEQPTRDLTNPKGSDAFLSDHFSWLTAMRRVDDRLVEEGLLNRRTEEGVEDSFRQTHASTGRANHLIRYGGINAEDFSVNADIPSYYDAARAVKAAGGSIDGWETYMLSKRTVEKQEAGIDTGFNPFAAREAASRDSFKAKYEEGTQVLQKVQDGFLKYMVDSGRLGADNAARMKAGNLTYVTMRRIMGDTTSLDTGKMRGRGVSSILSRMEGSDGQIVKPIMAMMDNMAVGVRAADKNRALGRLVSAAEESPEVALQFGLRKVGGLDPNEAELDEVLTKAGVPADKMDDMRKAFGPLVAERSALKPNQFTYYRDGVPEVWEVDNPLLAKAVQFAPSPQFADGFSKVLTGVARLLRAGVVVGNFPLRMALWHSDNMFVMDEEHTLPVVTTLKGFLPAIMRGPTWQKFLASGAIVHISADLMQDRMLLDMQRGGEMEKTGILDRTWNVFKHPLEAAEAIATAMDASNRIGYSLTVGAKNDAITPAKMGMKARKAGIDYAERGTAQLTNFMAAVVPFFRPHFLGLKQGWESITQKQATTGDQIKAVTMTVGAAMAAITIPKVINYYLNQQADKDLPEGQKYADVPRWQRTSMMVTPPVNGVRYTIRMPANYGFIFGDLVERSMDAFQKHDPKAFDEWITALGKEYMPNLFPSLAQPATEVVANHDFMTGHAVVPDSLRKLMPEAQFTEHTSATGRAVANVLNPGIRALGVGDGVSPMQVDHLIKGYTGTMGQSLLEALHAPVKNDNHSLMDVAGNLFVKGFVARNPGQSSQQIEDFYSDMEAAQRVYDTARREWKAKGGADTGEDPPEKPEKLIYMQGAAHALKVQRSALAAIQDNKDMSVDERRQASETIYHDMVVITKRARAGQEPE